MKEIIDQKMPSLTEWLEKIGHKDAVAFRDEDNKKRDRLEVLYQTIGLRYDRPERMTARDIVDETELFQDIFSRKADNFCALRLVPFDSNLPKLRVRGKTLRENLVWFHAQSIDPDAYKVEVIPHPTESLAAGIFLLTDNGVVGEITNGWHWDLTQGFYDEAPVTFFYNFNTWQISESNEAFFETLQRAMQALRITDSVMQEKLSAEIGAEFTNRGYLKGYFEFAVVDPHYEVEFMDYNRVLYKLMAHEVGAVLPQAENNHIKGTIASRGKAIGKARFVENPAEEEFNEGEILICPMTTVDFVPLMQKAAGIITEQGTILSHAAIVSRELKKPCLVNIKNARSLFPNGTLVEIDANQGLVKIL